ncbi:MAG: hypothetical protein KGJ60_13715, partial [Verrucomicrobiota bacterium]|nr:hypothetical protein [Verrucomicrobiota bacterium]
MALPAGPATAQYLSVADGCWKRPRPDQVGVAVQLVEPLVRKKIQGISLIFPQQDTLGQNAIESIISELIGWTHR